MCGKRRYFAPANLFATLATRKQYSAEEKIRIVLDGLRAEMSMPSFAGGKTSPRTCIAPNADLPGTPHGRPRLMRSSVRRETLPASKELEIIRLVEQLHHRR